MSTPIPRATVIGDGAMGTLCSLILAERGSDVTLWGRDPDHVAQIIERGENRRFLPGRELPENVQVTNDAAAAMAAPDLIISAVPCQFMRSVWSQLAAQTPKDVPIASVAKGLEEETLLLPTQIIQDCGPTSPIACLTGPCIAPEVAARKPATVVIAASDASAAALIQEGMSTAYFRVYTSPDLFGVELAAAVKNVIAIAAGLCDGIGAGDNAKASLLTRGLVEITRLGVALGAREATFYGLAGVGDLVTTCASRIGRNRTAGERIGQGESVQQVETSTESIIEGIATTRSVLQLAQQHSIEMPIVEAVSAVLFGGLAAPEAIDQLMTRPLKSE